MSAVIRVESLSKRYILAHEHREPYVALRDVLARSARSAWNRMRSPLGSTGSSTSTQEDFWALKDVSFEIGQGERVGIIGRNGAGKSTLLKILSRITEPTAGRVSLRGRIASLLEVGTGFHPELTGRENIYLNGAILGMGRTEIRRKFEEIVDFAGVERFLDTPVKRYSSGMYVRLAFAVAAHLDPEILIVDEVLAVGDVEFQKKCLGRMEQVGRDGRTVLFVSHNVDAIQRLCHRGLLLLNGRLHADAHVSETVAEYLRSGVDDNRYVNSEARPSAYFSEAEIMGLSSSVAEGLSGNELGIRIRWVNVSRKAYLRLGIVLANSHGVHVANLSPRDAEMVPLQRAGSYQALVTFPRDILLPGWYHVVLCLYESDVAYHLLEPAIRFELPPDPEREVIQSRKTGLVYLDATFNLMQAVSHE